MHPHFQVRYEILACAHHKYILGATTRVFLLHMLQNSAVWYLQITHTTFYQADLLTHVITHHQRGFYDCTIRTSYHYIIISNITLVSYIIRCYVLIAMHAKSS